MPWEKMATRRETHKAAIFKEINDEMVSATIVERRATVFEIVGINRSKEMLLLRKRSGQRG